MASSHDRALEDRLCKALTEMRRKTGVNQQDVADRLGVSRVAVWNWENCITFPQSLANLQRWAAVLGGKVEFRITTKDGIEHTFGDEI
jgi:transcriptional regulator with XRE-family HTH domain